MSDKYPGGFITDGAPAGFSVLLNGSSDYLTVPQSTNLDLGSGNWTVEAWVYAISNSGNRRILSKQNSTNNWILRLNSSGTGSVAYFEIDTVAIVTGTTVIPNNKWTHIAVVRNSNTVTAYVNGVSDASATYSGTPSAPNSVLGIGAYAGGPSEYFSGYISNARFVKGSAVYTAAFTPPTQLFPITNTQLLTCQSPTLIDNSTNAATITTVSGAKVSNFTPFAGYTGFNPALGAAAGGVWTLDQAAYYQNNRKWPIYDPYFNQTTLMLHGNGTNNAQNNTFLDSSTNNFTITRNGNTTQGTFTPFSQTGWSLYLPGSGTNYVQTPSSTTTALLGGSLTSLASLSFTIECFINLPVATGTFVIGDCDPAGSTANMIAGINSDGTQSFGATFGGYTTRNGTGAIQFNAWNHVAWVITGGYVYFYINGAPAGSATVGNTSSQYGQLVFGGYNNSFSTKQNVSNFRITKSAIYSGAFTPPTGPLTASTNTTLLTFQGNNYKDYSANNYTLNVVGSPTIQAFSPFVPTVTTPTTYSNYFSGSASYLSGASNAALVFGTGTYTIEMWVYQNARSGTQYVLGGGGGFQLAINSSGYIFGGVAGVGDFTAATIAASLYTWTHIAIVRNNTSSGGVAYYVNGVAAGTATDATNYTSNVTLNIGTTNSNVGVTPFSGFLSNLRVLKGTALYTASFTPPIVPLTAITNTSLLTCQSSTFIDNSTNALALTQTGTTYPVAYPTPFAPKVDTTTLNSAYSTSLIGGSAYFDGTGDYLSGTGNTTNSNVAFTVEAWIYLTSSTANRAIFSNSSTSGGTSGILFWINGSSFLTLSRGNGGAGSSVIGTTALTLNTWIHVAACRTAAGAITVFLNGVANGTGTDAAATDQTSFVVGAAYTNSAVNLMQGYISGLRVLSGTALYTSNFAPPTAPLTAITNTTLLTNFTNAGIYDNTAKVVLETVGDAQVSTTQSKYGGSSMKFDGTGDWLYGSSTPNVGLGSGNFTFETWVYPTTNPANGPGTVIDARSGANAEGWVVRIFADLSIGFYDGPANTYQQTSASAVSLNAWAHIACVRSGTTLTIFVNGVSLKTATVSSNLGTAWPFYIGNNYTAGYTYYGYLDDLRITKGVARYLANFTPPTSQLQDQ